MILAPQTLKSLSLVSRSLVFAAQGADRLSALMVFRADAKFFCIASLINILVLAVSCSADALPMQNASAIAKSATRSDGAPRQLIVQNATIGFTVADVSGTSGQTLPLSISIDQASSLSRGFFMFRGIPGSLQLTKGFRTGNSWLVSLPELEKLGLVVPGDFVGSFNIDVILVLGEGTHRQAQVISVKITSQINSQTRDTSVQSSSPSREQVRKKASVEPPSLPAATEREMMERATQLIKAGDVAAARLLYEHLAELGSVQGALNLAKTYDPEVLAQLEVVGMKPDIALARRWYERAAELGNEGAARRLEAIASSAR